MNLVKSLLNALVMYFLSLLIETVQLLIVMVMVVTWVVSLVFPMFAIGYLEPLGSGGLAAGCLAYCVYLVANFRIAGRVYNNNPKTVT